MIPENDVRGATIATSYRFVIEEKING